MFSWFWNLLTEFWNSLESDAGARVAFVIGLLTLLSAAIGAIFMGGWAIYKHRRSEKRKQLEKELNKAKEENESLKSTNKNLMKTLKKSKKFSRNLGNK